MKYDEIERQSGKRLTLRQQQFFSSDKANQVRIQLNLIVKNSKYNTSPSTLGNLEGLSFVDKHLLYLSLHPNLDIWGYLSNLRVKIKLRA